MISQIWLEPPSRMTSRQLAEAAEVLHAIRDSVDQRYAEIRDEINHRADSHLHRPMPSSDWILSGPHPEQGSGDYD